MKKALLSVVAVILLSGCSTKPNHWADVLDADGNIIVITETIYVI